VASGDIAFSNSNPAANEEITVAAQIHFWSSDPNGVATNVPIDIYATPAGSTSKVWIGRTTIASLSVASPDYGSRVVYATWKNQGAGIYIVEVDIDTSTTDTDQVTSNNAATRAIVVGTPQASMGAITGHVTGPFGGVAGVEVDVLDGTGDTFASTMTDNTGAYLFAQVPAGAWQVHVRTAAGYVCDADTKSATVSAGALSTVDFSLALMATPVPALPVPFVVLAALGLVAAGWRAGGRRGDGQTA